MQKIAGLRYAHSTIQMNERKMRFQEALSITDPPRHTLPRNITKQKEVLDTNLVGLTNRDEGCDLP